MLNDAASDGEAVYVSDWKAGKVYRVDPAGDVREVRAPESVNGITFHGGKMFAVSWDLHDVYELDPKGKGEPIAFGLASHFKGLDGIEVLDDGTFVVSDLRSDRVMTVDPDRRTVRPLVEAECPADIGVDREAGLLFVPEFLAGRVAVYRLARR